MARQNQKTLTGRVESLSHDGKGIATEDGKKVFVSGALPGETVEYRVFRRHRNYDEADTIRVLERSADRVEPGCPVFGVCGGCSLQHLEHGAQIAHKHQVLVDSLRRIGKVEPEVLAPPLTGPVWNYRRKARLGVKYVQAKQRALVGFRERFKPYIADMERCPILDEPVAGLPGQLGELISALSIRDQVPQVEVAAADNETALVFRVLQPPDDGDLEHLRQFEHTTGYRVYLQPGGLHSVYPLSGSADDLPIYRLDDGQLAMSFQPTDFVQINRDVNEALVALAIERLGAGPQDRVLDLFCGIGNFSLPLARRCAALLGIEGAATLVDRARANAERNSIGNARFDVADLSKVTGTEPWLREQWDLILLDPARAGAQELLPHLARLSPRRIVYVSCHPATLARDLGILTAEYGFRVPYAGIVDMFPHTAHVESIAVLEPR